MRIDQTALDPSGVEAMLDKTGGPSYANDKSPRWAVIVTEDSFPETRFTAICRVWSNCSDDDFKLTRTACLPRGMEIAFESVPSTFLSRKPKRFLTVPEL
jgi:hypothetical protein